MTAQVPSAEPEASAVAVEIEAAAVADSVGRFSLFLPSFLPSFLLLFLDEVRGEKAEGSDAA